MSEERAQQLMQHMQMLENYFNDLSQRESTLYGIFNEATAAIESIKTLSKTPDSDALVSIGMGTFVKAKISSSEKLVLNIGAGVSLEKDSTSAINFLEARIKEIQVAIQDTSSKKYQISAQLEQGKHQINQLIQEETQNR